MTREEAIVWLKQVVYWPFQATLRRNSFEEDQKLWRKFLKEPALKKNESVYRDALFTTTTVTVCCISCS